MTSTPSRSSWRAKRDLLVRRHRAAGRLLAVAEGRVEDGDAAAQGTASTGAAAGAQLALGRHRQRVQERHQRPQALAHLLDRVRALLLPAGLEPERARLALRHPLLRVGAAADVGQQAGHGAPRLRRDHARPAHVVAVLRGVRDRVAHVRQAAAVHEVHDQLQLVQALEVRDLRLVAGRDQRLEARLHQRGHAAAQHRLLAEEIRLGLLGEGRLDDARARTADGLRVRERRLARAAGRVLVDGEEAGRALALAEDLAHPMARRLGRDQAHVHVGRRLDAAEADVEAVREHQRVARPEVRLDLLAIQLRLRGVGDQDHHDVRFRGRLGRRAHVEALGLRPGARSAAFRQSHDDGHAVVPQVEGVRMALAPVAQDGHAPARQHAQVRIRVVEDPCHLVFS